MRIGLIATDKGASRYDKWVKKISRRINPEKSGDPKHTIFPGFEAIFETRWPAQPLASLRVDEAELLGTIKQTDRHQAIYQTVSLYAEPIMHYNREQSDTPVDLWMIVIPEEVYRLGRPQSKLAQDEKVDSAISMTTKEAHRLFRAPSLFQEVNEAAEVYRFEKNFHNQLKARLLEHRAVVQILRETTIAPEEFIKSDGQLLRRLEDPARVAWNLATSTFYKAGGQPWRLGSPRPGVCYVGIVFKRDDTGLTPSHACVGAQMFLDSGDGVVFRGAAGPWYSQDTKTFNLPREEAKNLLALVLSSYQLSHGGKAPIEIFIHGKTSFSQEEWEGFSDALPKGSKVVCIRIRNDSRLKLYRMGDTTVPRGLARKVGERTGFLWSKGFVPRLQTYSGREIPNPLSIQIMRGEADLDVVLRDVLMLTKLNYNACIFGDGEPVTLRFADAVGEILTAAPMRSDLPPLPFRFYI
ncbi:MAG: hypothetical protein HY202_06075 [Nitrospirae bacterium]|nr:hypothetical protein [Nitrospirota bacterium]